MDSDYSRYQLSKFSQKPIKYLNAVAKFVIYLKWKFQSQHWAYQCDPYEISHKLASKSSKWTWKALKISSQSSSKFQPENGAWQQLIWSFTSNECSNQILSLPLCSLQKYSRLTFESLNLIPKWPRYQLPKFGPKIWLIYI